MKQPRNRDQFVQRLLEIYRSKNYRTTMSGRKVRWDEPGEDDTPEVRKHNAFLERRRKNQTDAKERLKTKGIVPTKDGKPIFEESLVLNENLQRALFTFRDYYQSNRSMSFRVWTKMVAELLDDMN